MGTHASKVQGKWEHHTSRHNPKTKQKQTISKKSGEDPTQRGHKAEGNEDPPTGPNTKL
jgi:hypothetical protein